MVGQITGGKWLIHDIKHRNETQLQVQFIDALHQN